MEKALGHPFMDSKFVTLGHPLTEEIGHLFRDGICHFRTSING